MTLTIVLAIILLGILLIFLEVILIPGISVAGIVGSILTFGGIVAAFYYHGMTVGLLSLAVSGLAIGVAWFILLKTGASNWMANHEVIEGKGILSKSKQVEVGDTGVTTSRLNPIGNAEINGNLVEVTCQMGFVEQDKQISVVETSPNSILVKTLNV
jgi:membrane-bound ClpP family serine protease